MSNEDDIRCSNCGVIFDKSLTILCYHNLWMNCASENLVCNERPGINKIEFIICYICHSKTEIDSNASK